MSYDARIDDLLDMWEEDLATNPGLSFQQFVASRCGGMPRTVVDVFAGKAAALERINRRLAAVADFDATQPVPSQAARAPTDLSFGDLRPGYEPLPDYRLVAILGQGGFGQVWQATAPGGFNVALKFVPVDRGSAQIEERSLELLKQLRHVHLLTTFGSWHKGNLLIIASELADRTLRDRFDEAAREGRRGIPRDELLRYMGEVAEAIDFLNQPTNVHQLGLQHRDIKPENLFLSGCSVKVGDLGLVRSVANAATGDTGRMTIAYAAPEFIEGRTSERSDQYSLAVTYCFLRGGRFPFDGNYAQILDGHLHKRPGLSMISAKERPAVARALSKMPKERWSSCREFVRALRSAEAQEKWRETKSFPRSNLMDRVRMPRTGVMLAAGVITATLLGVSIFVGVHLWHAQGSALKPRRFSVSAGGPSASWVYKHESRGDLHFVLDFQDVGATLKFTVCGPDGRKQFAEGTSALKITVPDASLGDWEYTVTGLRVPNEDFRFTVTIDET